MKNQDQWIDVVGYETGYSVNANGQIYSKRLKRIMKPFTRGSRPDNKYLVVDLHKNKEGRTVSVHRIVAQAFLPNPNNYPCVNHKDGNKINNNVENLEWCTYAQNNQHARDNGLVPKISGSKNKNCKLTVNQVKEIKQNLILGDSNYGTRPLGKKYGVDHKVIQNIYRDKIYRDVKIPYTFFVSSDIHGAYTPWKQALEEAGFNENKYSHKIIVCGDILDRMDQPWDVLNYINHLLEKDKIILIRGNHEDLMEEMIDRGYAHSHDIHNGTYQSFLQLFPYVENKVTQKRFYKQMSPEMKAVYELLLKPVYDKMVNYFETENYVFCHGYIPDKKDWRTGNWSASRWVNGIETHHFMSKNNRLNTDKTIVCGHWHCSWGWSHIAQKYKEFPQKTHEDFEKAFQPYREPGLIAIDACTAYSGKVNVVVLEDNLLEESE